MFDTPEEKTDRELRVLAVEAAVAIYPHIDHSITQTCPADVRETILWLHAFLTGSDEGAGRKPRMGDRCPACDKGVIFNSKGSEIFECSHCNALMADPSSYKK